MKGAVTASILLVVVALCTGCSSKSSVSLEPTQGQHIHAKALPAGANQMCPVMPEMPVDPAVFVEYEGTRIYLCCPDCREKALKDAAASYAKAYGIEEATRERDTRAVSTMQEGDHARHETGEAPQTDEHRLDEPVESGYEMEGHVHSTELTGILPVAPNQMCPVMPEMKVDPAVFAQYEGTRIYLCCDNCREEVSKNPAASYAKAYGVEAHL